jgi:hypothetical protein
MGAGEETTRMADGRSRRRETSLGAVLGPLVMLATGLVAAVAVWRFLMLVPPR